MPTIVDTSEQYAVVKNGQGCRKTRKYCESAALKIADGNGISR
jgi:hypothetical protein